MVRLQQFSLALGVINNLLVCGPDNRILFAGDGIQKSLFGGVIHSADRPLTLDDFADPAAMPQLLEKISQVRQNKKSCDYFCKAQGIDLLIFPANYGHEDNVIIAELDYLVKGNNIESALKERVKELQCLYSISNQLEMQEDLETALENSTLHLAEGFQFPSISVSCIRLDGKVYSRHNCASASKCGYDHLSEDIVIGGKSRGRITVCYKEQAAFLQEERNLMRELSLMISRIIERRETRKDLETQKELLVSKNQQLTLLTANLTRMNNNLQAFLQAITDTIVVIDRNFNITLSNKEELGISGKCHQKIFYSDTVCENCPAVEAFETGRPSTMEKKFNERFFNLQAFPILDGNDGGEETVLEICRDVTRDMYMKSQLIQSSKLASVGKLVAGVAHEINNPNTFIRGNINIIDEAMKDIMPLLDGLAQTESQLTIARLDYDIFKENIPILIEDMKSGADRIKKIVDGLRNFAKKDEGLLIDDVDINLLIKNNMRFTEKEIRKRARFVTQLDEKIPVLKGNIQKLEQVIMNLLLNASQAMCRDKEGIITVVTSLDDLSTEITVKIIDNGKGMSEETQKHIFDPFFTTKREHGGTGLGLSISYGIIQEHNGKIEVLSRQGEGTTFTIRLPVKQSN